MLEAVVGTAVALLVILGAAIALGPQLPRGTRSLRALLRKRRGGGGQEHDEDPKPDVHPTLQRALQTAARLGGVLRAHGFDREAADLRAAARLAGIHEAEGLRALQRMQAELRQIRIEDESAHLRFRQLLAELRQQVDDRAEQLELLPF